MQAVSTQSPLIKRSRQEAVFMASSMIDRSIEAALSALQEAERQARSQALRLQLADAAAGLDKYRSAMRAGYAAKVDDAIGEALRTAGTQALQQPSRSATPENDFELTLVEDEDVARFVEASRLQQTALPVVEQELAQLDSLISSALGLPVVRADLNPLRPDVLCTALLSLLGELPEPHEVRAHWVRHLARPFAQELKRLYEAVVRQLQEQGVEEARYRLKLTESGAAAPGRGGKKADRQPGHSQAGATDDTAVHKKGSARAERAAARRAVFPRMEELAGAMPGVPQALMRDFLYRPQWVAEHDEPLPPVYYEAVQQQASRALAAPAASFDEAAHARQRARDRALAAVDRPARVVDVAMPLAPKLWGEQASPEARTRTLMELKSQAKKISQALGLDAVRTLVGQVAGDERVLAPVREAFVAMEPALLRMAMADPRFFGDDHHPARRLVEAVAQRSFKYNDEFAEDFEQFMQPVRESVRQLNARPQASAKAFSDHLEALQSRWQAEDRREEHAKEAGLRSMHFAQERQALADKIAREFSLRSDLEGVPAIVADFLYRDWSLVIAHAQLTDTRGQLDPGGYLAVVTDLLWSVRSEAALKDPARLFEVVPHVVQTLRRGLQMLGKKPAESEAFFQALMRYHHPVLRLRRLRSVRDAQSTGLSQHEGELSSFFPLEPEPVSDPVPLERPSPRAAEQPWLGQHELAAAGFEDGVDTGAVPLPDALPASAHVPAGACADAPLQDFASTEPLPREEDQPQGQRPAPPAAAPAPAPAASAAEASVLGVPAQAAAPQASHAPAQTRNDAQDEDDIQARVRAALERLRKGDWVDLRVHGQWRRAQLNWVSENGSLFMFVSRGGRPHSMTRRTCEKLLRNRHLRPVDASAVVDKALRKLADAPPSSETEA